MADQIDSNIKELTSLQKIDEFLKSADFYHVERCENEDCSNCFFVINLRYLYAQNEIVNDDSVLPLQKFFKMKYGSFHSVRLFLPSLGAIEKKRIELDQDFKQVLEIWNKTLPQNQPPPPSQDTQQ